MHLTPTNTDEWKEIPLSLLKIYVVLAYIVWEICDCYITGLGFSAGWNTVHSSITLGYVFSVVVLSLTAGVQYGRKKNRAASQTLAFALIGASFLFVDTVNLQNLGLWLWAIPRLDILINVAVLCCALIVRFRIKTRALTFFIWGCAINLVRETGIYYCEYPSWDIANSAPFWRSVHDFPGGSFLEFYWIGYIVAGVLFASGIILSIRQMQAKGMSKVSPNTAMYVALAILFLMIGMTISLSFFGHPEFLPTMIISGFVIYFSFKAYRQQRAALFIFLFLSGILTISQVAGLDLYQKWYFPPGEFESWLFDLLSIAGAIAGGLWAAGIILIILRHRNFLPLGR